MILGILNYILSVKIRAEVILLWECGDLLILFNRFIDIIHTEAILSCKHIIEVYIYLFVIGSTSNALQCVPEGNLIWVIADIKVQDSYNI